MIAFEVSHNGRQLCTAGVGRPGVLSAMVTWTLRDPEAVVAVPPECREDAAREDLRVEVGGLADHTHHKWLHATLQTGDEVLVRVCDTATVDSPLHSHTDVCTEALAHERDYVRRRCQEWGWQLTES